MVAQAHHDFKTSTLLVYMILNSKEGLTVGIVLCSVHYEQVNAICCLFLNKTIWFVSIFFNLIFYSLLRISSGEEKEDYI